MVFYDRKFRHYTKSTEYKRIQENVRKAFVLLLCSFCFTSKPDGFIYTLGTPSDLPRSLITICRFGSSLWIFRFLPTVSYFRKFHNITDLRLTS
jgi:hypothetical protein